MCPRCSDRCLFASPASIAEKCKACELDFWELERGSRAASLITFAVAAILIMIALTIESIWRPPLLLQFLFWAPVTIVAVVGSLRLFKTAILYANFEKQRSRDQEEDE
ncbi:MAG: DUF983 domain-containing protein [Erythrobacter sp.]